MSQQTEREFWEGEATRRQFCGRYSPPQPGFQAPSSVNVLLRCFWLRSSSVRFAQSLLVQSLSWLGVFSFLSSNLVLAQTSPSIDAVVTPTNQVSKPPMATAPVESAPGTPQSAPAPVRLERLRKPFSPIKREQVRQVPKGSVAQPYTNLPSPAQAQRTRLLEKTTINTATDNNNYIDPTEYSIGATRGYEAPSAVVLSERSTGCKATLRQGQRLSGSICGTAPRQTRVAIRGTQPITTGRIRSQLPSWARRNRVVARSGISPIPVGPISVSANGFRANRRMPVYVQGPIAFRSAPLPLQLRIANYNSTLQRTNQPSNVSTGLIFPLSVPAAITSAFGWRIHPITGSRRFHSGTDLGSPLGTPVMAAYAGNVVVADFWGGYGLTVVLEHNKATQQTLYGHMSEIFVQSGEWVEQGTIIGRVGSTGNSTGPHLHFETRQLTPEGWLATDPGVQLESALAQMVEALRANRSTQKLGV